MTQSGYRTGTDHDLRGAAKPDEDQPRENRRPRLAIGPRTALLAVLGAGLLASLMVNLPGHLTLDSVAELYEGRYRVRESWAPSFYAWVLGVFDRVWAGTGLYVAASTLLFFVTLASLVALRRRATWWAVLVAAVMVVSPLVLIYQGIVWKDVLFANVSVAAMACLAWAARSPVQPCRRGLLLGSALLLLAAAALIRQNGVLVGVFAAAALAWTAGRGGLARSLAWGAGALAAIVVVSHGLNLATQPGGPGGGDGMSDGIRILQNYDLLGMVAREPALPLPTLEASDPAAVALLRREAPRLYSAERTDVTDGAPVVQTALEALSVPRVAEVWRGLILQRPDLYLRTRASVFRWVFLTPDISRCVPVCLGVDGQRDLMDRLGLGRRWSGMDQRLQNYVEAFLHTPLYSHLAYALTAAAVAGLLLGRRDPGDVEMAALMLGALAFAASFFVISIACDYRYLYFLDLAAMTGLLYWSLDPSARRRRSGVLEDLV